MTCRRVEMSVEVAELARVKILAEYKAIDGLFMGK